MLASGWALIALAVAAGTESRLVSSTESPEREAQAAAGMANSGFSPEATTTLALGLPRAAEKKRSIDAARSYSSLPSSTAVLKPSGRAGLSPMRMTCASLDRSEPVGLRRLSVSSVTAGSSSPSEIRIGAPMGRELSTGAGHAGLPVVLVHQHHGGGPVRGRGGREHRAGHTRGVGGGVGAAHADRVLGGRGGEAQLGRGLLVVGLRAQLGRAVGVAAQAAAGEPGGGRQGQGRIGTCAHAAHCNWTRGPATSVSRLTGWSTRIVD